MAYELMTLVGLVCVQPFSAPTAMTGDVLLQVKSVWRAAAEGERFAEDHITNATNLAPKNVTEARSTVAPAVNKTNENNSTPVNNTTKDTTENSTKKNKTDATTQATEEIMKDIADVVDSTKEVADALVDDTKAQERLKDAAQKMGRDLNETAPGDDDDDDTIATTVATTTTTTTSTIVPLNNSTAAVNNSTTASNDSGKITPPAKPDSGTVASSLPSPSPTHVAATTSRSPSVGDHSHVVEASEDAEDSASISKEIVGEAFMTTTPVSKTTTVMTTNPKMENTGAPTTTTSSMWEDIHEVTEQILDHVSDDVNSTAEAITAVADSKVAENRLVQKIQDAKEKLARLEEVLDKARDEHSHPHAYEGVTVLLMIVAVGSLVALICYCHSAGVAVTRAPDAMHAES